MDIVAIEPVAKAFLEVNKSLGGELIPMATSLCLSLGAVVLAWEMIKYMLGEGGVGEFAAKVVEFTIRVGIPLWFVMNYQEIFGTNLVAGFEHIASTLTGGTSVESGIGQALKMILSIGQNLYADQLAAKAPAASILEGLFNIQASIQVWLFNLVILVLSVMIAAYFAVYMLFSQVLLGIALIIGPIFIPWLLLDQSSFLFYGWLRFTIIAGFYKLVGLLMLVYVAKIIPVMSAAAAASDYPAAVNVIQAANVMFVCGTLLMLAKQIPMIANGLISGHNVAGAKIGRSGSPSPSSSSSKPDSPPPSPSRAGAAAPATSSSGPSSMWGRGTQSFSRAVVSNGQQMWKGVRKLGG